MADLTEGEQLLWEGEPSWVRSFDRFVFGLALLLLGMWFQFGGAKGNAVAMFLIPIAVGYLLFVFIRRADFHYTVTSQRAMTESRLAGDSVSEIKLADLREVRLRRRLLDRLFGTGTLELSPADPGCASMIFEGISNPLRVQELLRKRIGRPQN